MSLRFLMRTPWGEANVFEPTELSVGRAYKVQWKKIKFNQLPQRMT